jgi:hypothetical protein
MKIEKLVSSLVASQQSSLFRPLYAISSGSAITSVQGRFGISMFTAPSLAQISQLEGMVPPVSISTLNCEETMVSSKMQALWRHSWPPNYPTTSPVVAFYYLKWEVPFFLKQFFSPGTLLEHVMCITGGPTEAFANCSGEYVSSQWPRVGRLLLQAIQAMLTTWTKGKTNASIFQIMC